MKVLAIDLGGTKLDCAAFTPDGQVVQRRRALLVGREGKAVGQLVSETACEVRDAVLADGDTVGACAVCVPGIVNRKDNSVWAPNIPGWERYPLRKELSKVLGVPVIVDNDRSCAIYGESWLGSAQHCDNALFIAVGTGIGVGIKIDGHVLHGTGDIAGAAGWLHASTDVPLHLEEYASGAGIADRYKALKNQKPRNANKSLNALSTASIFAAYHRDPIATKVIDNAIDLWAKLAADLVSLLNPEIIVWGGGVFGPAAVFLDEIYKRAERYAQPIAIRQVKFSKSASPCNPILAGAAYIALKKAKK